VGDLLLERERELAALDAACDGAQRGEGAVLVVAGEAGVGKSALLRAAAERAETHGLAVLRARGGELERDFAFGVARQLFEPAVDEAALSGSATAARHALGRGPGDNAPADRGERSGFELVHGLYWLTANLAGRRPLALIVDDAQWADAESLRFLVHLARRTGELGVALLVAVREGETGPATALLDALRTEPGVIELAPGPLSEPAVAEVVRTVLGEAPAPGFTEACRDATGGNAFLLRALLDELTADGVAPTSAGTDVVRVASSASVQRSVLVRLGRLGPAAVGLAQAVAVLEQDAELVDAATLAGLPEPAAREAADALIEARVLEPAHPLRFVHPLVQAAVYGDMGLARRADGHRRAAALLDARAPDRAVGHLLATLPAHDPWVLQRLRAGAERALARGSPDAARALLERTLPEAPAGEERARALLQLGRVELLAGVASADARLEEALTLAQQPELEAETVRELLEVRLIRGENETARALLARARETLPDPPGASWLELEAARVAFMQLHVPPGEVAGLADRLAARVDDATGETAAERRLLALLAFHRFIWTQTNAVEVAALAERAFAAGRLLEDEGPGHPAAIAALSVLQGVERVDEVDRALDAAAGAAEARGAPADTASVLVLRARLALFRGRLHEAEAHARAGLAFDEAAGLRSASELALAALVTTLVERGEPDAAERELAARPFPAERSATRYLLLQARAGVRRAQGRVADAVADLREANTHRSGPSGGSVYARALLAEALVAGGASDEAQALAELAVADAQRWGVPGMLCIALRAQGLAEGGDRGLDLLARAEATLADGPRRLEHARTLVELGAARRRANRRAAAREPLAHGMELAHRCGAASLAAWARDELLACGARPRRLVRSGVDALTPSELRVARLAAGGATNREIAQALFVTRKTVETHLAAIYRKLDVNDRGRLPSALEGPAEVQGAPPDANVAPGVRASLP
jgi:DNA-binding CsgD family transcriptional regulator